MSNENSYVIATVAVTAFPATAQLPDVGYAGFFSGTTLGSTSDPDVHVSFDGTTVHEVMRAGTAFSALRSDVPQYRAVWLKLSGAGSVSVKVAIERARS